jgi:hypothetical protein
VLGFAVRAAAGDLVWLASREGVGMAGMKT